MKGNGLLYLGVDGGGTKTALALIDSEGALLAQHVASGSYHLSVGLDALSALLATAVRALLDKAGASVLDIDFAFFGLPAHGEDSLLAAEMDRLPARCLPAGRYLCGNDMICGWAGSLACQDGINVVAGTGSICYGQRSGLSARCGGWGETFSDEGSAFWIAVRGLNLFARMSDGRASIGPLYSLLKQRLQIAHDLDLCGHIYTRLKGDRSQIAQLCRLVIEASGIGDLQAAAIITAAADELADLVDATRMQLRFEPQETIDVSCSGGVFADATVFQSFKSSLGGRSGSYQISEPKFPPSIGAALFAAKHRGHALSNAAMARLRGEMTSISRAVSEP